jgi:uncharacterized protein
MYNELRKLALVLPDLPADNFLLATAHAADAGYLATGDKRDLLTMKRFGRTRIVTARHLVKLLGMTDKAKGYAPSNMRLARDRAAQTLV